MLVAQGAHDEAAVVLGATDLVHDEVGVRVDFGLAHDLGPVRATVAERLGQDRLADLGGDGRVIGLAAAVRRAGERLLGDEGAAVPIGATVASGARDPTVATVPRSTARSTASTTRRG